MSFTAALPPNFFQNSSDSLPLSKLCTWRKITNQYITITISRSDAKIERDTRIGYETLPNTDEVP